MIAPYLNDAETGEQMLARLGYRWELETGASWGDNSTRKLVRVSDGHVMASARTVFDANHWAASGCPDLGGEAHVRPYDRDDAEVSP